MLFLPFRSGTSAASQEGHILNRTVISALLGANVTHLSQICSGHRGLRRRSMADLAPRPGGENLSCRLGRRECGGRHSAISVLRAIDHYGDAVGWHRAKIADRWGALEPIRQICAKCSGWFGKTSRAACAPLQLEAAVQCRRVDQRGSGEHCEGDRHA